MTSGMLHVANSGICVVSGGICVAIGGMCGKFVREVGRVMWRVVWGVVGCAWQVCDFIKSGLTVSGSITS